MKNGSLQNRNDRNELFVLTTPDHSIMAYCMTCGKDCPREEMVRLFETAGVCQSCADEIRRQSQFERRAALQPWPVEWRAPEPSLREIWGAAKHNRREFERHFDKVGKDKWLQRAEWACALGLFALLLYGLGMAVYNAAQRPGNPFQETAKRIGIL